MKSDRVRETRAESMSLRHPWASIRTLVRKYLPLLVQKVREKFLESAAAAIVGAAVAAGVFFVTSHDTQLTKLKRGMQAEVTQKLKENGIAKQPNDILVDRTEAFIRFPLTATADTVVMQGRFEPQINLEDVEPGTKNGLFIALFEETPKSLLDAIVGREPEKRLTTLITTRGSFELRISDLRVEDVFQTGEKAILFDLVEDYASGRSIAPIILYKYATGWMLTLLPDFNEEAKDSIKRLIDEKKIEPSSDLRDFLDGTAPVGALKGILYLQDWEMMVNAKRYSFVALRNSGGYIYVQHPKFGYRDAVAVASFRDGVTNASSNLC